MYDSLVENYRVIYEGALAPIFYKRFHPTHIEDDNPEHNAYRRYALGLKSDCGSDSPSYATYAQEYEQDLRDLLGRFCEDTRGLRRGVVVIPSSTKGRGSRVTELVRRVLGSDPAFEVTDLTRHFLRTRSKGRAHLGGMRSVVENVDTMEVDPGGRVQDYGAILVLDDITTSRNSFLAADTKLREAGFEGMIVNFAFARTCISEGVDLFMRWEAGECLSPRLPELSQVDSGEMSAGDGDSVSGGGRESEGSDGFKRRTGRITGPRKVEGVVFDLDDTLVCDTPLDLAYEEYLRSRDGEDGQGSAVIPCPYEPFPGVRDFMSLGIPFAVVSDRRIGEVRRMVEDPTINDSLYPGRMAREEGAFEERQSFDGRFYPLEQLKGMGKEPNQHGNLFSHPFRRVEGYNRPAVLYKPCPEGVLQAVGHVRTAGGLAADARIVGVGNTPEDMIAYKAAGIESVLALWGVPDWLRGYAERHWGADHCFGSMAEFGRWCGCF